MNEPLIYDLGAQGRTGIDMPEPDVPLAEPLPAELQRAMLDLPEVSEVDVVRHFTRLSQMNYSIDTGMYPLGSCTMKYNPKLNEDLARLPGLAQLHPYQPIETVQGALELMFNLQQWLQELGGFAGVSLQPAAGAHGEFTGILIIRAVSPGPRGHQACQDVDPRFGARHEPRQHHDERPDCRRTAVRRARQHRPRCPARRV